MIWSATCHASGWQYLLLDCCCLLSWRSVQQAHGCPCVMILVLFPVICSYFGNSFQSPPVPLPPASRNNPNQLHLVFQPDYLRGVLFTNPLQWVFVYCQWLLCFFISHFLSISPFHLFCYFDLPHTPTLSLSSCSRRLHYTQSLHKAAQPVILLILTVGACTHLPLLFRLALLNPWADSPPFIIDFFKKESVYYCPHITFYTFL